MESGLHLLGGDPLGYYRQPDEIRADLWAYWQLQMDQEWDGRWASLAPLRLADLALHGVRSGTTEVLSGLRAWLGGQGIRWRGDEAPKRAPRTREERIVEQHTRAQHVARARACGASKRSIDFWLGSG